MEKIIGQISVDSGEVIIADPCYFKGDLDKGATVVRHQTRSGDGMFDVIGRYDSKKRIRSLRVDFQTGTGHIIDAALDPKFFKMSAEKKVSHAIDNAIDEGSDDFWGSLDGVERRAEEVGDIDPNMYAVRVLSAAAFYLKDEGFTTKTITEVVTDSCRDVAKAAKEAKEKEGKTKK